MRGLKTLVIVLGVLLIGGVVTLVGTVVWRGTHPVASSPVAAEPRLPGPPFETTLDLPSGAEIASIEAAGERLVLQVVLPRGRRQLVIVDIRSGTLLGTIKLHTGP